MVADFIQRVTGYPVVSSAVGQASSYYSWAKERHAYIRSAADMTESGLKRVAGSTQPLLQRFEGRITSLDQLACQQLDRLESSYPVVREPTGKVVEKTYDYYNAAVKPKVDFVLTPVTAAVSTVQQAKSYSQEQYRRVVYGRYGQAGLQQLDDLIAAADRYVDRCLPAGESKRAEEEEEETGGAANGSAAAAKPKAAEEGEGQAEPSASVRRALTVGRKLRGRVYSRAADSVGAAYDRVQGVTAEFWTKVDELQKSNANGTAANGDQEKQEQQQDANALDMARDYLHKAQIYSVASLQVTGDHLPTQLLQIPESVRTSANLNALVEFVQHNRLTEYLFARPAPTSASNGSPDADDKRRSSEAEQQKPEQADESASFEADVLETTDDTVDSDSEQSE